MRELYKVATISALALALALALVLVLGLGSVTVVNAGLSNLPAQAQADLSGGKYQGQSAAMFIRR